MTAGRAEPGPTGCCTTPITLSPFPLRAVAGLSLRHLRRLILLAPQNVRLSLKFHPRQDPFLADVHRRQFRLFPAAFSWPCRHATPLRRLTRRLCRLEFRVFDWRLHFNSRPDLLSHHSGGSFHQDAGGGRQSLGRGRNHSGMDTAVAVPSISISAAGPIAPAQSLLLIWVEKTLEKNRQTIVLRNRYLRPVHHAGTENQLLASDFADPSRGKIDARSSDPARQCLVAPTAHPVLSEAIWR